MKFIQKTILILSLVLIPTFFINAQSEVIDLGDGFTATIEETTEDLFEAEDIFIESGLEEDVEQLIYISDIRAELENYEPGDMVQGQFVINNTTESPVLNVYYDIELETEGPIVLDPRSSKDIFFSYKLPVDESISDINISLALEDGTIISSGVLDFNASKELNDQSTGYAKYGLFLVIFLGLILLIIKFKKKSNIVVSMILFGVGLFLTVGGSTANAGVNSNGTYTLSSTGGSSYSTYNEDDIVDDGRFLTKHTPYPAYHEDDAFCGIGYNTDRAVYVPYLVEGYWPLTEPSLLCDVGNYSDFSTIGDSTTKHIVENELGGKEVKISSRIYRGMIASWKCSGVNEGVEKKCIWLYYPSLPPVQSNNCGTAPNPKTASASELCKNGSFMFGITDDNKLLGSDPSRRYSSTVGVRTYPTKSPSDPQIYYWGCFTDNINILTHCSQEVVDVCSNISGTQTSVPSGYTRDASGNCNQTVTDVCRNIGGTQTSVPYGYTRDASGNCSQVDVCSNISGTQTSVPTGYVLNGNQCVLDSNCDDSHTENELFCDNGIEKKWNCSPIDLCPNIRGNQLAIPANYTKNSTTGNCDYSPVDLCTNIGRVQTSVPSGYTRSSSGICSVSSTGGGGGSTSSADRCANLPGVQTTIPPYYFKKGSECTPYGQIDVKSIDTSGWNESCTVKISCSYDSPKNPHTAWSLKIDSGTEININECKGKAVAAVNRGDTCGAPVSYIDWFDNSSLPKSWWVH